MEENEEVRTKSFRDEDYVTRRVFLRSYPLRWGEAEVDAEISTEEEDEEEEDVTKMTMLKGKFIAAFHWGGGKILLLRKLKHKLAFLLVSCQPFGFKSSNKMLTL